MGVLAGVFVGIHVFVLGQVLVRRAVPVVGLVLGNVSVSFTAGLSFMLVYSWGWIPLQSEWVVEYHPARPTLPVSRVSGEGVKWDVFHTAIREGRVVVESSPGVIGRAEVMVGGDEYVFSVVEQVVVGGVSAPFWVAPVVFCIFVLCVYNVLFGVAVVRRYRGSVPWVSGIVARIRAVL